MQGGPGRGNAHDYIASAADGDEIALYTWPSGLDRASAERRTVVARGGEVVLARASFDPAWFA